MKYLFLGKHGLMYNLFIFHIGLRQYTYVHDVNACKYVEYTRVFIYLRGNLNIYITSNFETLLMSKVLIYIDESGRRTGFQLLLSLSQFLVLPVPLMLMSLVRFDEQWDSLLTTPRTRVGQRN